MTLVWCIAKKDKAVFFGDSSIYYLPYKKKEIPAWKNYDDFANSIEKMKVSSKPKWNLMSEKLVYFVGDSILESYIQKHKITYPSELADLILRYSQKFMDEGSLIFFLNSIVCGFNEQNIIELHLINKDKHEKLFLPNCAFGSACPEPIEILKKYIFYNDFSRAMESKNLSVDLLYECIIENMLKQGNMIFDEIRSKYPLFMLPLRIGQLDSKGFRWIQH